MGMVESAPGMSALDMNTAEDMIVRNTREVVPGMIICGMEVSLTWSSRCNKGVRYRYKRHSKHASIGMIWSKPFQLL